MDYQKILFVIYSELKGTDNKGKVASYIPELANINADKFGIHLLTIDGGSYGIGDFNERFSIQSIAKVFSLSLAYKIYDKKLWGRVGVEPSGNPFNSLVQLEYESGVPRNPFINSGALVICDILTDTLKNPKIDVLNFIRKLAGNESINFNYKVAESEKKSGYRNAALINLMKSYGNIKNDVDEVLDFYYHLCSVEMSCNELSQSFMFFANEGVHKNEKILNGSQTKRMNALMQTCGFYDEAGEFSFKVGLPGKSGVGGGIAAVHPGKYTVVSWSPKLNRKGNSYLGMKALEVLTTKTKLSIF
jgi:glutaminase